MTYTVEGKYGIKATVLARSVSKLTGIEFLTFEIEYPRIVLAELNTHRGLSKNSFSSRAVPFQKMREQLTGRPVRFGANQAGMQDKGEDFNAIVMYPEFDADGDFSHYGEYTIEAAWESAKEEAVEWASRIAKAGYHKQVYNRLVEPWQMMKTVISGTEWPNFFWLRNHGAADPTLAELARVMREAREESDVQVLSSGEWHLPYVHTERHGGSGEQLFFLDTDGHARWENNIGLADAIKISCARCAAVSYRNEDYGLEKSREVYDRLIGDERKHASAFEHCGTPMKPPTEGVDDCNDWNYPTCPWTWEKGVTHMDRSGQLWSGNLRGFIQYRKLIPGENYTGEY